MQKHHLYTLQQHNTSICTVPDLQIQVASNSPAPYVFPSRTFFTDSVVNFSSLEALRFRLMTSALSFIALVILRMSFLSLPLIVCLPPGIIMAFIISSREEAPTFQFKTADVVAASTKCSRSTVSPTFVMLRLCRAQLFAFDGGGILKTSQNFDIPSLPKPTSFIAYAALWLTSYDTPPVGT